MMKVEPIKEDAEFPNVALPVNEYYPALGEKVVAVRAKLSSDSVTYGTPDDLLNGFDITKWGLKLVSTDPATGVIVKRLSTDGKCLSEVSPGDYLQESFTPIGLLSDGSARFCVSMVNKKDLPGNFSIKLRAQRRDTIFANKNSQTDPQTFAFVVKHNGNVTLQQVLEGKAAFVFDDTLEEARHGAYRDGVDNIPIPTTEAETVRREAGRRFYYVQELLNQVMTRKRSVQMYTVMSANSEPQFAAPAANRATNNPLLDEDGIYNDLTAAKILSFRRTFKMDYEGSRIGNTRVSYANGQYALTENTSDIFRKLMKDYGQAAQANGEGGARYRDGQAGESAKWLGRIVDKATLVGTQARLDEDQDVLINQTNGNTRNDTGLYELYSNAVVPFVNEMIAEGERYLNSKGSDFLNSTWSSRPDSKGRSYVNDQSVSYCYGGKNTYEDFWNNVTSCQPPARRNVVSNYVGRVDTLNGCMPTGGDRRYPGLLADELNFFNRCTAKDNNCSADDRTKAKAYNPRYWTGIDCSGLVQGIIDGGRNISPGLVIAIPQLGNEIYSQSFFYPPYVYVHYWENPATQSGKGKLHKKLRKGDLVRYYESKKDKNGNNIISAHISTIYSDMPKCVNEICTYEIIHAYGVNTYQPLDKNGKFDGPRIFSRKVIRTGTNIGIEPIGFGRIKLWN